MKIVSEIPSEIVDIITKHDNIGRRELAKYCDISEHKARYYLNLWHSRLGDTDPKTIGMLDILKDKISRQNKVIRNLQRELATDEILIDRLKEFVPQLDISTKVPKSTYSKDKIDVREAITIWSDWHAGEVVDYEQVEGLNEYNLDIMAGRIWNMIRGTIRIINLNKDVYNIDTLNIDMLGDMVSGSIHDELLETNEMPILQIAMTTAYIAAQAIVQLTEHFTKINITCTPGNHGRCLSKSMELLTKSGWKSYNEIKDNEVIPTMNLETGYTEYQSIEQIHIYENDPTIVKTIGKINKGLEATPDHSLITYNNRKKKFEKKYLVKDLPNTNRYIPKSAPSNNIEYTISDDLLKLLGIILTDGTISSTGNYLSISQSRPNNVEYIENLLNKLEITFSKKERDRDIKSVCGKKLVNKPYNENVFGISGKYGKFIRKYLPNKNIQDWMFELSDRQVKVLLDGIIFGDGNKRENREKGFPNGEYNSKSEISIYKSKPFLDSLQALLVTHNIPCSVVKDIRNYYYLYINTRNRVGIGKLNIIEEEYNNTTWCVTVPNGSIFVRNKNNGRVFIVGNTTKKYQFKNKALNNYDTLFYQIVSLFLSKYIDEDIIEFNIPKSSECVVVRANWAFLLGHSDNIRGYNGIPWYGFQRDNANQQKIRKLKSVIDSIQEDSSADTLSGAMSNMEKAHRVYGYDYRECGHWHQMVVLDDWSTIINGALIGTNEYSLNKLHAVATPTQTLAFISEKYGMKGIEPIYCIDEGHNFNFIKEGVLGDYVKTLTDI